VIGIIIEGFDEIAGIITLAKELHDMGRYDIVKENFFDTLTYDSWVENIYGAISSVFSGFHNNYDCGDETDTMIFTDDVISDYYTYAWEFGKKTNTPYDKNPYAIEAKREVGKRLNFCYSMGWKLLGYTKTKSKAKQSCLIVYVGMCECDCHTNLAYGLIQLYKWFSDRVAEFKKLEVIAAVLDTTMIREEATAA
jgi:hypothetical protein